MIYYDKVDPAAAEFIAVATTDELPNGARKIVEIDGRAIAVFNIAGAYYAIAGGILGIAAVVATAAALLYGLRPSAPAGLTAGALLALAGLVLVAGAPTILGAWIGGYTSNDVLGALFFAIAAGAAFQVVVEVGRYVARHAPGGLTSGYAIGGFLAGIAAMYATGILAG